MTDEEIEKEAKKYSQGNFYYEQGFSYGYELGLAEGRKELEQWKQEWQDAQIKANEEGFARTTIQIKYKELEKENAGLKKEISVLLSCSNCPENKGGYICEKEYNDKCLAQKIEYIKELNEEIAELSNSVTELTNSKTELENKITELKEQIEDMKKRL